MLDHPLSGRHYACSTSKLKEGTCIDKMTKSGATVKICGCDSSDYCNYKLWPNQHNDFDEDVDQMDSIVRESGSESFPGANFRRHATDTSAAIALQRLPLWVIFLFALFTFIFL
ncbi:hypothetical protein Ddc_07796 [Ditylenchus destructor]|nr:hypothetical protein Ddc_07796 [Ditylenchus destructor]